MNGRVRATASPKTSRPRATASGARWRSPEERWCRPRIRRSSQPSYWSAPLRFAPLLALTGGYVALMCWIDIYWVVIPEFSPGVARFGLLDVLCLLGMSGVYSAVLLLRLNNHSVLAERDPRIVESLVFESA